MYEGPTARKDAESAESIVRVVAYSVLGSLRFDDLGEDAAPSGATSAGQLSSSSSSSSTAIPLNSTVSPGTPRLASSSIFPEVSSAGGDPRTDHSVYGDVGLVSSSVGSCAGAASLSPLRLVVGGVGEDWHPKLRIFFLLLSLSLRLFPSARLALLNVSMDSRLLQSFPMVSQLEHLDGFTAVAEHLDGFPSREFAELMNSAEVPEECTSIRKSDGSIEHPAGSEESVITVFLSLTDRALVWRFGTSGFSDGSHHRFLHHSRRKKSARSGTSPEVSREQAIWSS